MLIVNLISGLFGAVLRQTLWMDSSYAYNALPWLILPKVLSKPHSISGLLRIGRVAVEKLPSIRYLLDVTMKNVARDRRCMGCVL